MVPARGHGLVDPAYGPELVDPARGPEFVDPMLGVASNRIPEARIGGWSSWTRARGPDARSPC